MTSITTNENFILALNELAKFQQQYLQAISNLQIDYIHTVKNMIHNSLCSKANGWQQQHLEYSSFILMYTRK